MYDCADCGKSFLTKQAEYGHRSMCPDNSDRSIPDDWAPADHGRWQSRSTTE